MMNTPFLKNCRPIAITAITLAVLVASTVYAGADAISIHIQSTDNFVSEPVTSATAGAVPRGNWNTLNGGGVDAINQNAALKFNDGTVAPATVSWRGHNTWAQGDPPPDNGNGSLLRGYLDDGYEGPQTSTIKVAGITFPVYDVYVYSHGDGGDGPLQGTYFANSVQITSRTASGAKFLNSLQSFNAANGIGGLIASNGGGSQGNYIVFRNMTSPTLFVTANELLNIPGVGPKVRAPLNGIQIVLATPAITSVTQNRGSTAGGDVVTVFGGGFLDTGVGFTFGGAAATNVKKLGNGSYSMKTPPGAAGQVNVVYTAANGTVTLTNGFTYAATSPALGDTISFNVAADDQNGGQSDIQSLADPVGVPIPLVGGTVKKNWNNSSVANKNQNTATDTGLTDNLGTNQNVSISWRCEEHWTSGTTQPTNPNGRMMRGYINSTNVSPTVVQFRNLPAGWTNFDVYIYLTEQDAANRHANFVINDVTKGVYMGADNTALYPQSTPGNINGFVRVPDNTGLTFGQPVATYAPFYGNFVVFPNVTAENNQINITDYQSDADFRVGIASIQLAAPAPVIVSVSPASGPAAGGTAVTINGSNFRPGSVITIGGAAPTNVTYVSSTQYTCNVPPHALGAADVVMTDVNGRVGTLLSGYNYATLPIATVTSVTPNTGPAGQAVTIAGTNFRAGATVQVGGTNGFGVVSATSVVVVSATSITCNIPTTANPAGSTGATRVQVTNTDEGTAGFLLNAFTYTAAAPTVTSITPNTGSFNGSTNVTINGTGFAGNFVSNTTAPGTITVGGQLLNNIAFVSNTQLTGTVLPMTVTQTNPNDVVVTNPGGGPSTGGTGLFTYTGLRAPENDTGFQNQVYYRYFHNTVVGAELPFLNGDKNQPVVPLTYAAPANVPLKTGFIGAMDFGGTGGTANPFLPDGVVAPPGGTDNFAVEYWGFLNVPRDGFWTLLTGSDDGTYFILGDATTKDLVVSNNFAQGTTFRSGTRALKAGRHRFIVQFAEGGGGANLQVRWSGPGQAEEPIPQGTADGTGRGFYGENALTLTSGTPTPLNAAGGQAMTITGTGFGSYLRPLIIKDSTGATIATINNTSPAPAYTVASATTLNGFNSPPSANAGPAPVTITTVAGQTATLAGALPTGYVYLGTPVTLLSVTPNNGASSGGLASAPLTLTATGPNFTPSGVTVTIGGVTVPATTTSPTTVTFVQPPHAVVAAPNLQFDLSGSGGVGLTRGSEHPAITTGTAAGGETGAGISYNTTTKVLTINISWTNLSGAATAGHIHGPTASPNGDPFSFTEDAAVKYGLDTLPGWNPAIAGGFTGTVTILAADEPGLLNGQFYINVHTAANANGEIRGYLIPQGNIAVKNGDSQQSVNSLKNAFTYNPPALTTVAPNTGLTNGGNSVTLTGTNFGATTTVTFGGIAATNVVVSSNTTITCVVPASAAQAVGPVNVVVSDNQTPVSTSTLTNGYTYVARAAEFANTTGKVQGVNAKFYFGNNTGVIPGNSPLVFDALLPYQAKRVTASVMAEVTPPGTILSLVPAASVNFNTKITGYGAITTPGVYTLTTSSDDGTVLYLGDPSVPGTFTKVVDNNFAQGNTPRSGQIFLGAGLHKFTILYGQGGGGYDFSASISGPDTGGATVILPDAALFTDPIPTVTNITPNTGSVGGNTPVTITGTGFVAGAAVAFNGVAATNVVVVNATTITARTPGNATAGTVNAVVQNPNGLAESIPFIYSNTIPRPADIPTGDVAGVFYRYYNLATGALVPANLSTNTPFRVGAKTNATVLPENTIVYPITRNDDFLFQMTGFINIPYAGTWTFYTAADDGTYLYIGGAKVVANNNPQGITTRGGTDGVNGEVGQTIALAAGKHAFTLQFCEGGGGFGSYIGWGCNDAPATIPLDPLGTNHGGPPSASNQIPDSAFTYVPPTWISSTAGNWTTDAGWNTNAGLGAFAPVQTDTTDVGNVNVVRRFAGDGTNPFSINHNSVIDEPIYVLEFNSNVNGNVLSGNRFKTLGSTPAPAYNGLTTPNIIQNGSGTVNLSAPLFDRDTITFGGNGTGIVTISGALTNYQAVGDIKNLVKSGTSTFSITGTGAGFNQGTIAVNAGTLGVNSTLGTVAVPTGAVTIATNGRLRGTGTINGNAVVNATGTIFPGDVASVLTSGTKGTLTVTSANFSAGGALQARIRSTGPGPLTNISSDQLVLSGGTVTLGGTSALRLVNSIPPGTYTRQDTLLLDLGATANGATTFTSLTVTNASGPSVGFKLLYVNNTFVPGTTLDTDTTRVVATQLPGAAATPLVTNFTKIYARFDGAVTPVTMDSLAARAEGAGTLVEWRLASEFQNAGFNIYRRLLGAPNSEWVKANPTLIAGRLTNPSSQTYRFYDWAAAGVYEYRLEHVDLGGTGEFYAQTTSPVAAGADGSMLSLAGLGAALEGLSVEIASVRGAELSRAYVNPAMPDALGAITEHTRVGPQLLKDSAGQPANTAGVRELASAAVRSAYDVPAADGAVAARGLGSAGVLPRAIQRPSAGGIRNAAKLVYSQPGVIFLPKSMLPASMNINRLNIVREGRTQSALALTGNGLLLYGPGYEDDYTNKDAFFLSPTGGATLAGSVLNAHGLFTAAGAAGSTTVATKTMQYHDTYFDWALRPYDYPPYFSSQYLTQGGTASFPITLDHSGSGSTSLTVNVWSLTAADGMSADHALQAFVNGTAVGQAAWNGGGRFVELTFQVPSGVLHNGSNLVDLVTPSLPGVNQQIAMVHSMSVNYTRDLSGPGTVDITHLGKTGRIYEVSNMPTPSLWVVDARYPDRAALVPYEAQAQADGSYKARFMAQAGGTGKYLVVPAGAENTPLSVTKRSLKPLQAGLKYLATGPAQFSVPTQSLLMQRNKEGLKGAFVDQEQLFDYYNYGRYGPDGIRNAVRATRPQYLLLAGRTTTDYRDYAGTGVDPLCPTYLVSTTFWSQATSDSMFGDLGRGYPEVKVGRIPANNAGEYAVAVRNILGYKGLPASGWRGQFTADVTDAAAGDFAAEADSVIASFPDLSISRNYLGVTYQTAGEVTDSLTRAANGGAQVLFYNGHGSAARLGNNAPRILDTDTVQAWNGNVVFIAATCTFNWVAKNEDGYRSIPIQAMVQPQGGMAASIGTTTYMNSAPAVEFTKQLLTQTQNNGVQARWGDVVLRAQQWAYQQSGSADGAWYMDLSRTECILGDPAMPVYSKGASGVAPGTKTPAPATSGNTPGTF